MDKKLNEVTKVTDMAYVPVIMADGSIGQIAKSDLASVVAGVLGNPIGDKTYYIQKDLDNLTENGIYSCYYTQGDRFNEAHYPGSKSEYLQILVSKSVQWIRQTAIDVTTSETFVRAKDGAKGWSPWTRLDNFGYNSLAELAGGVAGQIGIKSQEYTTVKSGESLTLTSTYGFCFLTSNQDEHVFFHHTYSRVVNIIFQTDTVSDYTNVKDTEGKVNIYKSSSDNLVIQNKSSKDYGIRIVLIGQ